MAKVIFNGVAGESFTNSGDRILYQLHCKFGRTCGLCLQYHMAIGPSWPIPFHRGCVCEQTPIFPGQSGEPFVDFREMIREMDPAEQAAVMGRSNLQLVESGVVKYEDVVTKTRVRDLREVVSRGKLTVEEMIDAGVGRRQAERAYETVHTPAHELADAKRRELIDALRGKGIADDAIRRAVSERIALRIGIDGGPSGPFITPFTPRPIPDDDLVIDLGDLIGSKSGPKKGPRPKSPKKEPRPKPEPKPRPEPRPEPKKPEPSELGLSELMDERGRVNKEIWEAMSRQKTLVEPYTSKGRPVPADVRAKSDAIQGEIDSLASYRDAIKSRQKLLEGRADAATRAAIVPTDRDQALLLADRKGVRVHPKSPNPVTMDQLADVLVEVDKIPQHVIDVVAKAGRKIDVINGVGITDHPDYARYKGEQLRGHPDGVTWDTIPGAGGPQTIVVANRLFEGHGSANLILHEHAHTFDSSTGVVGRTKVPSDLPEWREVWEKANWASAYEKDYPEEGYAESFAKYFHGPATRATLDPAVRTYWEKKEAEWSGSARGKS